MILECYQTVEDRNNLEYVEANGPFWCKRPDAWLGDGYYIWDSNIDWAHGWGKVYEKGYIICAMSVYDGQIFDLWGSVNHQREFAESLSMLKSRGNRPGGQPVVARDVLSFLRKTGSFLYDGIRSFDEPTTVQVIRYNNNRREELVIGQRVQICLLNKKPLLSHTFRIVFPENYVL